MDSGRGPEMLLPGRFLRAEGERAQGERKEQRGISAREKGGLRCCCQAGS